ncbi:MAG TPA: permease [bacterium]|nr:permease [bacterium]
MWAGEERGRAEPADDLEQLSEFRLFFVGLIVETTPFIAVASLMAFIFAFVPQDAFRRLFSGNKIVSIFIAAAAGFVIPLCECSIVPIAARLARRGLPLPVAVTLMVAVPSLSPIVVASTSVAFSSAPHIIHIRFAAGFILAVATGLIFLFLDRDGKLSAQPFPDEPERMCDCAVEKPGGLSFEEKVKAGLDDAAGDFTRMMVYIVAASAIAAAIKSLVPADIVSAVGGNSIVSVPAMMLFSFILSTCSDADAFIPAAMIGFSAASKLSFMLLGPALDLKLSIMHFSFLPRRAAVILIIVIPALVLAASIVVSLTT